MTYCLVNIFVYPYELSYFTAASEYYDKYSFVGNSNIALDLSNAWSY